MHGYVQEERLVPPLSDKGIAFFKMPTLPARTMATQLQIHEAIEMIYVKSGSIIANIDGVKRSMHPGDFAFFRSRGVHGIYTEDESANDYYVLKIMPKYVYDLSPKNLEKNFPNRFLIYNTSLKTFWTKEELCGSEILRNLERLINELDEPAPIPEVSTILCALNILEQIYRSDYEIYESLSDTPDDMLDIVAYVNVWFEMDLTAEDMAKRAHMSAAHFSRAFKKVTGKSFKDYLNFVRLNHAEFLIINTDLPITEIAMESGYSNVSYFTAMYKKAKGVSPTTHRKTLEK